MAKEIGRKLKIYVNGNQVENTITNMRKSLAKLRSQANKNIIGSEKWKKYNKEVAKTEVELKKAYAAQKSFKQETKLSEKSIGKSEEALAEFTGSLATLIAGAKSGDILQIKEGFNGIKKGIKGATKAAWAFIATPIGAAIALLAGVGLAAKQWFNYNNQVTQALQLTTQLTGLTDKAADSARIRAEVITETFGGDFKENMLQARSLVTQFGISYNAAFDTIEKQLVRGQKNNTEFGKSIKEYSTFFAGAKFSADEFGRVIAAGYDLGFYDDKLPDAIKEFDLAIKEQTPATRDALINAFGKPFTDDILKRVRTGEVSTKDALKAMSKQADKTGLNLQQNAQLTADLFKGAGEDAGGAKVILDTVNKALSTEIRALRESEQIKQDQINSTKELKAITSAFFATGDKGWGLLVSKGKLFATQTLVKILKSGIDVYNWFVDLNNESVVFSALLVGVGKAASFGFAIIGELISAAWQAFKGLGNIIAGIFTFDWERIKQGFAQQTNAIGDVITNLKDRAIKDANDIYNALQGKNKKKRLSLDDFTGTEDGVTPDKPKDQTFSAGLTPGEKAALLAKQKLFKKAEEELTKFIAEQHKRRANLNKSELERALIEIDDYYAKQLEKAQGHDDKVKQLEALRDLEKSELRQLRKEEELARIKEFEEALKIEQEEFRLEEEAEKAETDEERILLLLAKTKWVADQELDIERRKEIERLKIIGASKKEIELVNKKFDLQRAKTEAIFRKGKAAADKHAIETEKTINKQRTQAYADMFGDIAVLLGKNTAAGKAAAIAQATINTYQGVTEVWTAKSSLLEPYGTIAKVISTAVVLASGLGAVKKITATSTPSFARGGLTGIGSLGLGSNAGGQIRGVVEEDEYVIPKFVRQDPEVAPVLEYLEAKRTGNVTSFANGGDSTTSTDVGIEFEESRIDTTDNSQITLENLSIQIARLNQILDVGIIAKMSNDIENSRLIKEGLDEEKDLRTENIL